ncbi:MAG: endonuclease/exonuclease/phosphatase family protein [Mycobacterium sp.]|nr:endonuclease/exonuclease/phosphatase family protein [Mycobacterium sp.]
MALPGWLATAAGLLLFLTRYLRISNQAAIIAATFAHLAPVSMFIGAVLLALGGNPGALVAIALTTVAVAAELRPWLHRRDRGAPLLRVLTLNVWLGQGDPKAILELARGQNADVIALQETTEEFVEAIRGTGIDADYPHSLLAPGPNWRGVTVWSRFPLRDPLITEHGNMYRVEAVAQVGLQEQVDDPVIASLHLHAPWPGAPGEWVDDLMGVSDQLRDDERPLILAGDYNATWDHAYFRRVLRDATDATVAAGAWTTRTWPTHLHIPCVIAIDHVLLKRLSASKVTSHVVSGADHRALVATITRP